MNDTKEDLALKTQLTDFFQKEIRENFLAHGGDIELQSVENGVLTIKLNGACHNCPSAKVETEEFVEAKVKQRFPEIKEVHLTTGVSDELLKMAQEILNTRHKS
ncbi:MAG: NifU family protein [Fusobacteriaceae bacterium]|jgi:Fe-S cluster biogenesis protein NfuA|nr:NifU family protein [Fusobacteriaceae bacterium]